MKAYNKPEAKFEKLLLSEIVTDSVPGDPGLDPSEEIIEED